MDRPPELDSYLADPRVARVEDLHLKNKGYGVWLKPGWNWESKHSVWAWSLGQLDYNFRDVIK